MPWLLGVSDSVHEARTILLRDAPRAHVCRTCGEIFLGDDVPVACPVCEAPNLSLREELPVWYLDPADRGAIVPALAVGPRHIEDAIRGVSHPDWGQVTVLSQAAYIARHEASHLAQLAAAASGRLPGRSD